MGRDYAPCPRSRTCSSSWRSPSRRRCCSACSRACCCRPSCSRSWPGSSSARPCSAGSRSTRRSRWSRCSASRSSSSSPGSRSSSRSCAGACSASRCSGFAISFAVALVVSLGLQRGGPRRHPAAGRDHPVLDVARRAGAGAQGLRAARDHVRAADHRRGLDRRLRGDHPALDLLLRGGRDRRDAAAARRRCSALAAAVFFAVRGRRALAPPARGPAAAAGHDRADPRPRVARAAASASPRSPSRSGSR